MSESRTDHQVEARIGQAFSPAAPIDKKTLFAGRDHQMRSLIDVIFQRGQHAVLYGERGVGKTSLAAVMAEIYSNQLLSARVTCDGTDTFASVWRKVLNEIQITEKMAGVGFKPQVREVVKSVGGFLPSSGEVTPDTVRLILHALSRAEITVIVIDEFDRINDVGSRTRFADTIKVLSDQLVGATIVLVGVADTVDELIAEHRSVERALVQIHMPRMSLSELEEIVSRGVAAIPMTIDPDAMRRVSQLSQGLPHYTHLVAQAAARAAVEDRSNRISLVHADAAIAKAIGRAQESIIKSYHQATSSSRETLYPQVILACALAQRDDLGFFAAPDVRAPLSAIMGKKYEIPAFSPHLHALSAAERGPLLQKTGVERRFRFRFVNPLVQPYVVMRGLSDGKIDAEVLGRFSMS